MKSLLFFVPMLSLMFSGVSAQEAAESSAGFRNAALIYTYPSWTTEAFKPLIAYKNPATRQYEAQPLFDGFLFLNQRLDKIRTDSGKTRKTDWEKQFDLWFTPGREIDGLNQAALELRQTVGVPATPLNVICYIPYPHPDVTDFGDVDGDGTLENLSKPEDLAKVLRWYIDELIHRMEQYPALKLTAFYWMPENVEQDRQIIQLTAQIVHEKNKKFVWIPWFRSAGWETWKECGFDYAIMQSNYAFQSVTVGGSVRSNRLDICADLCLENGMGMEVELPYLRNFESVTLLRRTFEVMQKTGLDKLPTGFFFSAEYPNPDSPRSEDRELYQLSADYLSGKLIESANTASWQWHNEGEKSIAETDWDVARPIRELNILLKENPEKYWKGIVMLEGLRQNNWEVLGWILRNTFSDSSGAHQIIVLPIFGRAEKLRLTMIPEKGSPPAKITEIQLEEENGDWIYASSTEMPYRTDLPKATPNYPELPYARKFFDGVKGGAWSNFLGWHNSDFGFVFDLGRKPLKFDEVRLYTLIDSRGAIRMPENLSAAMTNDPELNHLAGLRSAVPEGLIPLEFIGFTEVNAAKDKENCEGFFSFKNRDLTSSRYLIVDGKAISWGMFSEVEFLLNGKRIFTGNVTYRLTTPLRGTPNQDDGAILTDGKIAAGVPQKIVIVPSHAKHFLELNYPAPVTVSELRLYYHRPQNQPDSGETIVTIKLDDSTSLQARTAQDGEHSFYQAVLPQAMPAQKVRVEIETGATPLFLTELVSNQEQIQ